MSGFKTHMGCTFMSNNSGNYKTHEMLVTKKWIFVPVISLNPKTFLV